jgi:hypothetical protein
MNMTALIHAFPSRFTTRSEQAQIWLLLSNRVGDNNQLYALAEALELPFAVKDLAYNELRRLRLFGGPSLASVTRASRKLLAPPWPLLVISAGYPSVPVARYIRQVSCGRTKIVHVGNARSDIGDFDLHLTTPQYPARGNDNEIELPLPIGNPAKAAQSTPDELDWLRAYPRPRRLIAVGGPARHWELDHATLANAIETLSDKKGPGSVIVTTSARTRAKTRRRLETSLGGDQEAVIDTFPRFAVLLAEADEIYVTADSVSMISEAVLTGKPVGIIPIRLSVRGQLARWLLEPFGKMILPNFPNFWNLIRSRRLAGTVELPVACQVCDTVDRAATAVRSLLAPGDVVDREKPERSVADLGSARCPSRRQ